MTRRTRFEDASPRLKKLSGGGFLQLQSSIRPKGAKDAADAKKEASGESAPAETPKPKKAKKPADEPSGAEPALLPLP